MKQKKTNQKLENETNIDKYNYKSLTKKTCQNWKKIQKQQKNVLKNNQKNGPKNGSKFGYFWLQAPLLIKIIFFVFFSAYSIRGGVTLLGRRD